MTDQEIWENICALEGTTLKTFKGLDFTYSVKGREIFISRKDKSITWSSVVKAIREVEKQNYIVTGPKKIGVFGASYIYPIFIAIGLIKGSGE